MTETAKSSKIRHDKMAVSDYKSLDSSKLERQVGYQPISTTMKKVLKIMNLDADQHPLKF